VLLSACHFAVSTAVFRFSAAPKGAWPSLQGGRCYKHGAPNGAESNRRLFRLLKARHTGQPEVELQHPPARLILNPAVQKPRITRMTLKRAVQPQMDTDEHRFTANCRAAPPHPQGECLRRGLHQCLSVSICGFIVSTAVLCLSVLSAKSAVSTRMCWSGVLPGEELSQGNEGGSRQERLEGVLIPDDGGALPFPGIC